MLLPGDNQGSPSSSYQHQGGPQHGRQDYDQDDDDAASLSNNVEEVLNNGNTSNSPCTNYHLRNFLLMSTFFSLNHGCVVACLSLATAQLGALGNWQSGLLYMFYTGSALFGATFCVKQMGPKLALVFGMTLYCVYVATFWVGTVVDHAFTQTIILVGASIGGVGAGLLWTAQGSFFARSAEAMVETSHYSTVETATARLASFFATCYLGLELLLRSLSSLLIEGAGWEWSSVFALYALVTLISTGGMLLVGEPPGVVVEEDQQGSATILSKATAAIRLLRDDRKMQCMVGLNAVFGFASAFLNSYINGYVIAVAINKSEILGALTAWVSAVAAGMSLLFGRYCANTKGKVLIGGSLCFLAVAVPFMIIPAEYWTTSTLLVIFTLYGTGRATFESTLKATFAEFFAYEKEGAFANIVLQNGLASAIGFAASNLSCHPDTGPAMFCVKYTNGSYHNVSVLERLVVIAAFVSLFGYRKASRLHDTSRHPMNGAWTALDTRE